MGISAIIHENRLQNVTRIAVNRNSPTGLADPNQPDGKWQQNDMAHERRPVVHDEGADEYPGHGQPSVGCAPASAAPISAMPASAAKV